MAYKPTYVSVVNPTAPTEYQLGTYTSQYGDQLASALNNVVNWKYNPLEDASYQALAKIYGARGNRAAKDTLADAAALNGGYGTSYAVSAAQQARNQYNQEFAALIPELESAAYQKATGAYDALRNADDTDYNRWRDSEGDRQWLYSQQYQRYQDALNQYQWALDYNNSLYQQAQAAKASGGSGRRRSGGGSGGYGGGTGFDLDALIKKAQDDLDTPTTPIVKNSANKVPKNKGGYTLGTKTQMYR